MLNVKQHAVFSFARDNRPIDLLTISQLVLMEEDRHIVVFSLGKNTEISEEYYPGCYAYYVVEGTLHLILKDGPTHEVHAGEMVYLPKDSTWKVEAPEAVILVELDIKEEHNMNLVKHNEVFKLAELLPTEEGKIVNADLVNNEGMKVALMSFDAGCALPEHAAPGDAIIFALEGEGQIMDGGEYHDIKAGENYSFGPGGRHSVIAKTPFKMCLVLAKAK